jgi:hypothetical protein
MKLLTAAIIKKLEKAPLYSTDGINSVPVLVKFFSPWSNWTWYAIEGTKDEDGWLFFGLVEGHEKELGYFRLSELESVRGRFGLKIERDMYFDNMLLDKQNLKVGAKPL